MSAAALVNTGFNNPEFVMATGVRTAGTGRIRLTRRGRIVLTMLAAAPLIALAAYFGLSASGAVATSTASEVAFDYVTIEAGESLWQIAVRVAPQADPRDVISDIMRLNQLDSSSVVPGQRVAIPSAYAGSAYTGSAYTGSAYTGS